MSGSPDCRQYAPAAERNREPICSVLAKVLPATGTVLEIASGTGQHAAFCAPRLAPRHWLASDPNPEARASIQSWIANTALAMLHGPLALDMTQPDWTQPIEDWRQTPAGSKAPPITAIANINMIHISPWAACEGLMTGAAKLLATGDVLYLYGPFKQDGKHTAPSNEAFDQSLRSRDSSWGVRDLGAVAALAAEHQLQLSQTINMPANNQSVIFTRI